MWKIKNSIYDTETRSIFEQYVKSLEEHIQLSWNVT